MAVLHAAAAAVLPVLLGGAAAPDISPGDGAVVTDSTVTVSAKAGLTGGTLIVDGQQRASGRGETLTFTIDGHAVANGTHTVEMTGLIRANRGKATFRMAVPAYAPAGVVAVAAGRNLSVVWQPNPEPDVTGYSVATSAGGSAKASADCPDGRCTAALKLPASASGELTVTVVAHRAGAGDSGAGAAKLVLPAAQAPAPAGDDGAGQGQGDGAAPGGAPVTSTPTSSATPGEDGLAVASQPADGDEQPPAPTPVEGQEAVPSPAAVAGVSPTDPLPRIILWTSVAGALATLLAFGVRAVVLRRRSDPFAAHVEPVTRVEPVTHVEPPTPVPVGDDTDYREPWT
ncbi:hypothetical protein [Actinocorallia sp. A-T 12471]|uniref:hypothetical protein n=1 Tax=Actinocorallia sp. A-T 12471 TaxID=3089813 RepID=UPI0029CB4C04|nr:hypothetical protein [Actinocorallia sp. A-T 12471]MDX6741272.1 hypothetical protein [Actinocorallia sp. A-T 12471]